MNKPDLELLDLLMREVENQFPMPKPNIKWEIEQKENETSLLLFLFKNDDGWKEIGSLVVKNNEVVVADVCVLGSFYQKTSPTSFAADLAKRILKI